MKIQYCSDLHLEFRENKKFLDSTPITPGGDILLLAGDIVPFRLMKKHADFFNYISDNFEITYWLPGNHEYYYYDITKKNDVINEKIRDNIFLVNNLVVHRDNVRFLFSTLWTEISFVNQWKIQQRLSDFHVIRFGDENFTPDHYNRLHQKCKEFLLTNLLKKSDCKTFVVTHHVPTFFNYPDKYKGDILNEVFASELYDFIEQSGANNWLFGHHHQNVPEFNIGNTKMINNQLGYVKYNEHYNFSIDKLIEL